MDKTIEFEDLMDMVEYVDCIVNDLYILKWDGETKKFKDTADIVPFVKGQGWTVTMDGEEL